MNRFGDAQRPQSLTSAALGVMLLGPLLSVPARADQSPAVVPIASPAPLVQPTPGAVREGIAALRGSCSDWLHADPADSGGEPGRVFLGQDGDICRFVTNAQGETWSYSIRGGLLAYLLLIPASILIGAAWGAFGMAARGCCGVVNWLLFRIARA
jgi:hypothetical protein